MRPELYSLLNTEDMLAPGTDRRLSFRRGESRGLGKGVCLVVADLQLSRRRLMNNAKVNHYHTMKGLSCSRLQEADLSVGSDITSPFITCRE